MAKAQYRGGDTAQKKTYTGRGGHRTYFLDWVNDWGREGGGTPHIIC